MGGDRIVVFYSILNHSIAVSDAMEICFVIVHHITVRPILI